MRSHRFLSFSLLTSCFLLLLAPSSAKAQCGTNTIGYGDVGDGSGNPFHAEVTRTSTGHTDMKATLRPTFPEWVARDSQGHIIMICDPAAQTMTQIDTATATARIIHSRPSAPRSSELRSISPRSFCSSRLPSARAAAHLQVEDLGIQIIEGVEAHGERITLPMLGATSGEESPNGENTSELWCSDSLSALVLRITANTKTGVKSTIAMQKIERTEPDPALFQIPEGYAITESVAEPREHRGPNATTNEQP